jgi:hypothetical protein
MPDEPVAEEDPAMSPSVLAKIHPMNAALPEKKEK